MRWMSLIVAVALAVLVGTESTRAQVFPDTMQKALDKMKSGSDTDRAFGIVTLGLMGKEAKGASKELVYALFDSSEKVRKEAALALPMVNPEIAEPAISLARGDAEAKAKAVALLGKLGKSASPAIPALLSYFEQAKAEEKVKVVQALAEVGKEDKSLTTRMVQWAMKDPDAAVRAAVLKALPTMAGIKDEVPNVLKEANGRDPKMRVAAITVLADIGKDNQQVLTAMEGMSFETPKGRMTFRKEDHQAMQDMFHFRIKNDPAFPWGVPELVRVIKAEELKIPVRNKR